MYSNSQNVQNNYNLNSNQVIKYATYDNETITTSGIKS